MSSAKLDSPSAHRNKEPIWNILESRVLTSSAAPCRILEVAAGCGVHTDHFATALSSKTKNFVWYPTDPCADARASIDAYVGDNLQIVEQVRRALPLTLDEKGIREKDTLKELVPEKDEEKIPYLDLILCINMIHISPWEATVGLMNLAGETLSPDGGVLYCYGPYKVGGTAVESNL
jgi:Protein of unknown function (DUF938)